jgi:hypothetical protein
MMRMTILSLLLFCAGCETIYHHNTVYQYDAVVEDSALDEEEFPMLTVDYFKPNNCSTGHYGDLKPYNKRAWQCEEYDNGYCCLWDTEASSTHVCLEEWCYWKDTCEWDLNGWGQECFIPDGKKEEK